MGILDFIQRARQAQQENPQQHDVQLEILHLPFHSAPPPEYRIELFDNDPIEFWGYEWATEDEITESRWREVEALWEDHDLSRESELTEDPDDDKLWDSNELPADFLRGEN